MADHIRFTHIGQPANVTASAAIAGGSLLALTGENTAAASAAAGDAYFGYAERDVASGELFNPIYDCEVPVVAASALGVNELFVLAANGQAQPVGATGARPVGRTREAIAAGARGRVYIGNPV